MRAVLSSMSVSTTNNNTASTLLAAPSTTPANDLHHLGYIDPSLFSPRQLNNQRLLHTPTSFLTNNQQSAFYRNNNNNNNNLLVGKTESNFVDNNWFDNSHNSTIINESDFPSLGVRWSPSSFGAASSTASVPDTTSSINSYGSVVGSSPVVTPGGGILGGHSSSSVHHQSSLHNALFNREATAAGLHNVMTRPYANLIRDGTSLGTTNVFRMQNEDFPALPGAVNNSSSPQTNNLQNLKNLDQLSADMISNEHGQYPRDGDMQSPTEAKPGIQTHSDGLVTNIPPNMLNDQYGMAGLLTFLRTIESDPNIVALALGHDLTSLGLNLNAAKRNLHTTFAGPWSEVPCRIQDMDVKVPDEYLTNATIREKLPNIKLNKLTDDVLFYLFYNCPGEVYQVAAASELFQRDWRFHKVDRVWLTRSPFGSHPREHTGSYEKSSYNVFDPVQWRKIPKEMVLEYKQLEGRPSAALAGAAQPAATSNSNNNTSTTNGPPPTTTPLGLVGPSQLQMVMPQPPPPSINNPMEESRK